MEEIKGTQVKKGAILSYLQIALNIIIGLLYTPIMIRLLGQSEYGLYNTVSSTISMLSILSLGFNAGYVRYYAKYKKDDDYNSIYKLNGMFLLIFIFIGLIAFLCGFFLTLHLDIVFDKGLTSSELHTAGILMLILTFNLAESFPASVFSTIISANEKFVFLKFLGMIKSVLGPFITLPLLLMGYGSIAMISVSFIVTLGVDIIYTWYVLKRLNNKFIFHDFEKGLFKQLSIYTSFIALNMVVDQINWNIDKILLGRFRGTVSVAVYSVGYSLFNYYLMLSTSISGVFTPRIHSIVVECSNNIALLKNKLTDLFIKVGRIQYIILALVASGFVFFGKEFIFLWAGYGYNESYFVALLLIFPGTIALIQNMGIEMQRAQNLHQFRSVVYLFMAFLNLGLSIICAQLYGAVGCAFGTAISLIVANGIIMNIYYYKKCNIDVLLFWKEIVQMSKGLLLPIATGILWDIFIKYNSINIMLVGIILYVVVYFLSMYHFSMNEEEKGYILLIFNKIIRRNK